jgi:hypothetical protein
VRGPVGVESSDRRGDGALGALGLALGAADDGAEVTQLLADGAHPGIGLVQPLEAGLDPLLHVGDAIPHARQREPGLLDQASGRGSSGPSRLVNADSISNRLGAPAVTTDDEAGAIDVAVGSDRRDPLTTSVRARAATVGDQGHPVEQLVHRRAQWHPAR